MLQEYLEFVVPGQSGVLVGELRNFLSHRELVGGFLLVTMLFFSALAFTVLENAMSVIFFHRVAIRRRHFLVSAALPYLFIMFLGIGMLIVTLVSGVLHSMGTRNITIFGQAHSLGQLSAVLLYIVGVTGEALLLTAIYLVMPVGRLSLRYALIGRLRRRCCGRSPAISWSGITRRCRRIQVVYGSLTTAIVVLLSVEIGAVVLLLGAQVIAEYERIGHEPIEALAPPMRTEGRGRKAADG